MKKMILCCALLAAIFAFSARLEARTYEAAKPPRPGERARAVLDMLDAKGGPIFLKYRTEDETGESATVTFAARGEMAYTDMEYEGGRISTLYDGRSGNVTIISHFNRSYIVAKDSPAVLPFGDQLERAADGERFSASSGSEKINGARYDFDRIIWDDGTEERLYFLPMTDTLKWWRVGDELYEILEYGGEADESLFKIPEGYREEKFPT